MRTGWPESRSKMEISNAHELSNQSEANLQLEGPIENWEGVFSHW